MAIEIKYEILTLREDKAGQTGHWQTNPNSPYGSNSIAETNSESTTEPTSIPSPFARMELARTAFEIAANCKTWDEVPNRYKKIVSDCLDVAEIFFNYPMYKDYVEIIKWDKNNLNQQFGNTEIGKSMSRFIQSDSGSYNFDRMSAIYLLNYIGDNRPNKSGLNIIGATSPITMFFSVGNNLRYVGDKIHFTNQDKPFDDGFNPLETRDPQFIHYLNDVIYEYNNRGGKFANDFKSLYNYILVSINRLSNFTPNNNWNYNSISFNNGNDSVEVLGFNVGQANEKTPIKSDFEINSKLITNGRLPLILPSLNGNAYKDCSYIDINDKWGGSLSAPFSDQKELDERILPGRTIKYPYLTVNDFFEDTIIKMPHKLNGNAYFNLNGKNNEGSYLLPFKQLLFEYFTVEEVMSMVKTTLSGNSIEITLDIPIKNYSNKAENSYVSYKKTYQQNKSETCGGTIVANFGFGLFPLVKTNDVNVADYRVAVLDKVGISNVEFYLGNTKIGDVKNKIRRERTNLTCGIKTYVIGKQHFDRIDIQVGNNHGYIIPKFKEGEGSKKFRFAVDFGTTNTHIAFSIDNEKGSTSFECNPQMVRLHEDYGKDKDIYAAFEDNYVPSSSKMSFPMRSAFAEVSDINYNDVTYTISDGNIPFRYEKVDQKEHLIIQTGENLKWSANSFRIELYIRNIAFILHNKVLLEGGSLKDVEIRWFYPASMSNHIKIAMEDAWNRAYRDYFNANLVENSDKITSMSESIAPYCHYITSGNAMGVVTTIDIGGGTTDVYISNSNQITGSSSYLMSFRFASNALFGDGYNNNIANNGFIRKYKPLFESVLRNENSSDLMEVMSKIANKGNSVDLTSFFFSLASQGKPGLNFLDRLSNDEKYKYVFLIFYTAIIYHVAQVMKSQYIEMPQTVAFSGNGSKTLQVLSKDFKVQKEFVKSIFEKVYEKKYPENITFILKYDKENPKEATANGGLEASNIQVAEKPISMVLLGVDNNTLVKTEKYTDITDSQQLEIVNNVIEFIDFIPSLNENNLFGETFGMDVSILNDVIEICKNDLKNYLNFGLGKINDLLSKDKTSTKEIKESLFFFPIVGMLNNLASKLYELDVNN